MLSGPLLLLLSAFLHALWNAYAKKSQDKGSFLFLSILTSGVATLILISASGQSLVLPNTKTWVIAIFSGVFEGLYFLTLGKAYAESSLGKSYAIMRGGAMVVVWMVSAVLFGEATEGLQFLGALIILSGILIINYHDFLKEKNLLAGNKWSLLSAVFIAGYHLAYHQALNLSAEPKSLFFVSMMISLPFLYWGVRDRFFERIKLNMQTHGVRVIITGLIAASSFLIFLYGLKISAPGYAISLRNTSIFFAVVFSFFLRESLTRTQILGAALIGLGALLLA